MSNVSLRKSTAHTNLSSTPFWPVRRETTLNWLALGLLLAAWNATDNDAEPQLQRPHTLRGYDYVSPRAVSKR